MSEVQKYDHLNDEWHPTKNGDLKFTDFTPGSQYTAWWSCTKAECGCIHEWPAKIGNRTKTKPSGCPFCSPSPTVVCIHNSLAYLRPELMNEWDYDMNINIDPFKLPVLSNMVVHWKCKTVCPIGGCEHRWETQIDSRTRIKNPSGCPFCSPNPSKICYHQSLEYLYPDLMKQWHPTKNGNIDPSELTPGSHTMVQWLCVGSKCGCIHEWPSTIYSRVNSPNECPFCIQNTEKICIHGSLEFNYPEIAKEWNTLKNGDLKPSEIAWGSHKKVWWKCTKNGHEWPATPNKRTGSNRGCPFCKNKTEAALFEWLQRLLPDKTIKGHKWFDWCRGKISNCPLPFDFYIVELNKLIELDGPQHFQDVSNWESHKEIRKTDVYKMKLAIDRGISVIRITQTMFKGRLADMKDILLPYILDEELEYTFICENNEYKTHKIMLTKTIKDK